MAGLAGVCVECKGWRDPIGCSAARGERLANGRMGGGTSLEAWGQDRASLVDIGKVFILGQAPKSFKKRLYEGFYIKRPHRGGGEGVHKAAPKHL